MIKFESFEHYYHKNGLKVITKSFTVVLILSSSLCQFSFAQSSREIVTQSAEWFALTSNIKLHKHLSLLAEGQFRYTGSFNPMQFQFRTGVEVHINKQLSIMPLGYVYSWNPIYGKLPALYVNNEHRIFEQVVFKHSVGRVTLSHRGRLEQRYVQVHVNNNGEVINEGYDLFMNRARYRFMMNIPINHSKMEPKTIYISAYDEAFFSWGKKVTYDEPDQNRIFAGLGYQLNKKLSAQGGFFYQMLIKSNGKQQENNVGFQVQLIYNIDLTKN